MFLKGQKPVTGWWVCSMGKAALYISGAVGTSLSDKFPASQFCSELHDLPCPGQSKQKEDPADAGHKGLG